MIPFTCTKRYENNIQTLYSILHVWTHSPSNITYICVCPQKYSFSQELSIIFKALSPLPSPLCQAAACLFLSRLPIISNGHFSVLTIFNFLSAVNVISLSSLKGLDSTFLDSLSCLSFFTFSSPFCILFLQDLSQIQDSRPLIPYHTLAPRWPHPAQRPYIPLLLLMTSGFLPFEQTALLSGSQLTYKIKLQVLVRVADAAVPQTVRLNMTKKVLLIITAPITNSNYTHLLYIS